MHLDSVPRGEREALGRATFTNDERMALLWAIEVAYGEEGNPNEVLREGWSTNAVGMLLDDVLAKLRVTPLDPNAIPPWEPHMRAAEAWQERAEKAELEIDQLHTVKKAAWEVVHKHKAFGGWRDAAWRQPLDIALSRLHTTLTEEK